MGTTPRWCLDLPAEGDAPRWTRGFAWSQQSKWPRRKIHHTGRKWKTTLSNCKSILDSIKPFELNCSNEFNPSRFSKIFLIIILFTGGHPQGPERNKVCSVPVQIWSRPGPLMRKKKTFGETKKKHESTLKFCNL